MQNQLIEFYNYKIPQNKNSKIPLKGTKDDNDRN